MVFALLLSSPLKNFCPPSLSSQSSERITPTTVKFVSFKPNEVVEIGSPSDDPLVLSGFKRFIGLTGEQITDSYINGSLPEGVTTNHNDEILFKCHTAPSPECLSHRSSGNHALTLKPNLPQGLSLSAVARRISPCWCWNISKMLLRNI
jgi:hypothetical protein